MFKSVLLTCFVAAASAKAQLGYAYGAYPYAAAYGAYPYAAAVPFGSSTGLDPITQGLDPVTQGVAVPAAHYLGKRSADADADAQYALAYGAYPYASAYGSYPYAAAYGAHPYAATYGAYPYAAAVPFGSSTGLDPITQGLDPVTQGVAVPAVHYLGKRSADADADAQYALAYGAYPYASAYGSYPYAAAYGAYPYAATYGAYPYAAAVPFGSSTGLDPITQGLDPVTQGVAVPAAHYIGKRSADADADAYYGLTYGAYPYASYAHGAYPYAAAYGAYPYAAAYGAYPYAAAVPFGSSTGLDPITQGLDPVTQGVAVPAYGYAYGK